MTLPVVCSRRRRQMVRTTALHLRQRSARAMFAKRASRHSSSGTPSISGGMSTPHLHHPRRPCHHHHHRRRPRRRRPRRQPCRRRRRRPSLPQRRRPGRQPCRRQPWRRFGPATMPRDAPAAWAGTASLHTAALPAFPAHGLAMARASAFATPVTSRASLRSAPRKTTFACGFTPAAPAPLPP